MSKTLSIGLTEKTNVNYIVFKLNSYAEIDIFFENLSVYIINKYTNYLLNYAVNKNYGYLSRNDKAEVYKRAKNEFSKMRSKILRRHKSIVKQSLYEYFLQGNADSVVLEGFVRFRLGNYLNELEDLVDCVADEFFIDLEYKSFLKLLKEFMSFQKSKIRLVHIKIETDERYFIYDENFEELSARRIFELTNEFEYEIENENDFLLSSLINLAPKKIVIHNKDNITNTQLFETLNSLFLGRITICDGCTLCDE